LRTIRRIGIEDLPAFYHVMAHAYAGMGMLTEDAKKRILARAEKAITQGTRPLLYAMFEDGQVLGLMYLYDYEMNLLGVETLTGGVGNVAVDLFHKKQHVAKDMMEFYLRHYRDRGSVLTLLYPFRHDFYKQMGFGFGTRKYEYSFKPTSLPDGPRPAHVRALNVQDLPSMLLCHNSFARRTHGMIQKIRDEMDLFFEPGHVVAGYIKDGQVKGYVAFRFEKGQHSPLATRLIIRELIYDRETLPELLSFLRLQADQIDRIVYSSHDEHFVHLLSDPYVEHDRLLESIHHESSAHGVGLMYRVINTRRVFEVLKDRRFGCETCKLRLDVRDGLLPENDEPVFVSFTAGAASLYGGPEYDIMVSMDISEFSSLLMGSIDFRSLYDFGLATISDESHIGAVDRIFRTEEKPQCDTRF